MATTEAMWGNASMYHTFASFADMCRWVANGRKLEDLQGDCKDEWVTIKNLPEGVFAVIMEYHAEKLIGLVVMKAATDAKALISIIDGARFMGDQYCSVMVSDMMVWPLGAGDTITIGG